MYTHVFSSQHYLFCLPGTGCNACYMEEMRDCGAGGRGGGPDVCEHRVGGVRGQRGAGGVQTGVRPRGGRDLHQPRETAVSEGGTVSSDSRVGKFNTRFHKPVCLFPTSSSERPSNPSVSQLLYRFTVVMMEFEIRILI